MCRERRVVASKVIALGLKLFYHTEVGSRCKHAAYATSQARGRGNTATQLGPGTFVTCKATHFGEEYAKELFGHAWRGARLSGVVENPVGFA